MSVATILIGPSGIGKSTFARKTAEATGRGIVSRDSIREMLLGKYDYKVEYEIAVSEIVLKAIGTLLDLGKDVIIDSTNLSTLARRPLFELFLEKKCEIHVIAFVLEEPIEATVLFARRYIETKGISKEIWENLIKTQIKEQEKLSDFELINTSLYVELNSDGEFIRGTARKDKAENAFLSYKKKNNEKI